MGRSCIQHLSRLYPARAAPAVAGLGGKRDAECARSLCAEMGAGPDARKSRSEERGILALGGGGEEARLSRSVHLQRRSRFFPGAVESFALETLCGEPVREG